MISKQIIANPQSKGGAGKSTHVSFLTTYYDSNEVVWTGSDADTRHATFLNRHPKQTMQYSMDTPEDAKRAFASLFRRFQIDEAPVHVIDCAAQSDAAFIAAVEQLDIFARCSEQGIRMTLTLFPTDEYESMVNFASIVEFAEDAVDYIIVHNPAKNRGDLYKGSALERTMVELGAKSIIMPRLMPDTILAMERAESIAGRGITYAEFALPGNTYIDPVLMGDMQWALNDIFAQYDKIANLLLPTKLATEIIAKQVRSVSRNKDRSTKFRLNFGS